MTGSDDEHETLMMLCDDYLIEQVNQDLHFFITEDLIPPIRKISGIDQLKPTNSAFMVDLEEEESTEEEGLLILVEPWGEDRTPDRPITGDLLARSILIEEQASSRCVVIDCQAEIRDPDFSLFCLAHNQQAIIENWPDLFPRAGYKPPRPRPASKSSHPNKSNPPGPAEGTIKIRKGKDRK